MHLAGQSFMAEARTRKNVCFNFGARLPVAPCLHPFPSRPYSAAPDAALNYSECEKIRKIRPSALPCISVPPSLLPPFSLSLSLLLFYRGGKVGRTTRADFSSVTA